MLRFETSMKVLLFASVTFLSLAAAAADDNFSTITIPAKPSELSAECKQGIDSAKLAREKERARLSEEYQRFVGKVLNPQVQALQTEISQMRSSPDYKGMTKKEANLVSRLADLLKKEGARPEVKDYIARAARERHVFLTIYTREIGVEDEWTPGEPDRRRPSARYGISYTETGKEKGAGFHLAYDIPGMDRFVAEKDEYLLATPACEAAQSEINRIKTFSHLSDGELAYLSHLQVDKKDLRGPDPRPRAIVDDRGGESAAGS